MSKKVLGRGLRALIPTAEAPQPAQPQPVAPSRDVAIDDIRRNPEQPRRVFAEAAIDRLADSIRRHGVLQPLLVRPLEEGFELVAGERRWLAARRAGLKAVPVQVREVSDDALLETALVENIQREDLNPIEEAEAFRRLTEDMGLTQAEVAERVGRDRSSVANSLRLLSLPGQVRDLVESGGLAAGHARPLLGMRRPEDMIALARETVAHGLSVRQVETRVRSAVNRPSGPRRGPSRRMAAGKVAAVKGNGDGGMLAEDLTPAVRSVRDALIEHLATRVRIETSGESGAGAIVIEFYSDDDLSRLASLIIE